MIPAVMARHTPGAAVFLDGRTPVAVRQHFPAGSSVARFPHYVVTGLEGLPLLVSDDRIYPEQLPAAVPSTIRFGATVDVRGWRTATEDERHAGSPLLIFETFEPWAGDSWEVENAAVDSGVLFFTYRGSRCSARHLTEAVVAAEEIEF